MPISGLVWKIQAFGKVAVDRQYHLVNLFPALGLMGELAVHRHDPLVNLLPELRLM